MGLRQTERNPGHRNCCRALSGISPRYPYAAMPTSGVVCLKSRVRVYLWWSPPAVFDVGFPGVRVRSKQEDRTESDISVSNAGKYPLNSSFCPITLKSSSKDAGAAPASFELLFRCMRQKLDFSAYFPAGQTPPEPNQIAPDIQGSPAPSVFNILPSH